MQDIADRLIFYFIKLIYFEIEPEIKRFKRIKKVIYWIFQIVLNLAILIYLYS